MFATIVRGHFHTLASADARRRSGRKLGTALGALPGFVAFVALDTDPITGAVAALCIFEQQESLAAAEQVIAQLQQDALGRGSAGIEYVGRGAVIAQKGL